MIIYFLRHASAGERKKDPIKDGKRGLDRAGIEQAVRAGRLLAGLTPDLDAIFTSPLKRAAQTAALVANEIGFEGKLTITPTLRPESAYAAFQQLLGANQGQGAILVVGHNPNLAQFLGRTVGSAARPARLELRKGGLARVELERTGAVLDWLLTPKLIRAAER